MSIMDSRAEYLKALEKAHLKYPHKIKYSNSQDTCNHNFSFIIYCDGGDWDIARCPRCGAEQIVRCTFDDDYD